MPAPKPKGVRLQKYLSDCGIASRRHCEDLIIEGRVLVNDEIIDTLPAFVQPGSDRILVDGQLVKPQRLEYFLVHKPKGVVCSNRDPKGRTRAVDLLPPLNQRLFVVGRLDEDSSGLLLMTNDGEIAQHVTHPRYGMPKVYRVTIDGLPEADLIERMRSGVFIAEGKAKASHVEIVRRSPKGTVLEITLREGRNRQIRRMLAKLGHKVRELKRTAIGPLELSKLPLGASRRLSAFELKALRRDAEAVAAQAGPPPRQRKRRSTRKNRAENEVADTRPASLQGLRKRKKKPESDQPRRRIIE
jgi:23S rRNA pseudouridine2605 synthase